MTDIPVIERKFFGGTEQVTYECFASDVIQDEDEARGIAERMLDGATPYPFNTPATGAEPEFYEEFQIIDADGLRAQIAVRMSPLCPDCHRPIALNPSGWWSHDGLPDGCWRLSLDGPGPNDSERSEPMRTIIVAVVYAVDVPPDGDHVATWQRFVEELPECPGEKVLFTTGELACEPRDVENPDFDVDVRSHGRELRPLTDE